MSQHTRHRPRRVVSWAEQDAFTRWRHFLHWRPGERKWAKRSANRRERREARQEILAEVADLT